MSLWKTISIGWSTFSLYIQFEIGDGTRVKFRHDVYYGENPLSVCFPKLFRVNSVKEAYLADLMQFPNGVHYWDLGVLACNSGFLCLIFWMLYMESH